MGPGDLSAALAPLPRQTAPQLLVGRETFDDAGVYVLSVNLTNLANGETVRLRVKTKVLTGDTAETAAFREHRRFGPFDAAIMPIGAYDPWIRNHCTPEQAVMMADAAGARGGSSKAAN